MDRSKPELRTDPLTGRSVLVAEHRAQRPNEFAEPAGQPASAPRASAAQQPPRAAACPFCPGREQDTPPAVYEKRSTDGHWQIRVVPNKYPAVSETAAVPAAEAASPVSPATKNLGPALGAHEVIVETPRHVDRLSALSASELGDVLSTYAQRLRHWRDDQRLDYGLIFRNQGQRAGASLGHAHSQFIALPAVPPAVVAEVGRAEAMFRQTGHCPYCRLIDEERSRGERVVYDADGLVAFCPFASLQPYEVWLLPAEHAASFEDTPAGLLGRLAGVLHAVAGRVESVVADAAFNMMLRTAPWRVQCGGWNHWRIELVPRVVTMAGFELASGMSINAIAPERAASKLRLV